MKTKHKFIILLILSGILDSVTTFFALSIPSKIVGNYVVFLYEKNILFFPFFSTLIAIIIINIIYKVELKITNEKYRTITGIVFVLITFSAPISNVWTIINFLGL